MNFHRKKSKKIELNLIPLINIVFLLLIFFITVGKIDNSKHFDVKPPSSSLNQIKSDKVSQITLVADNKIYLGTKLLSKEIIRDELKLLLSNNPNIEITIKSDKNAKAKTLTHLIKLINHFGGFNISLVVIS